MSIDNEKIAVSVIMPSLNVVSYIDETIQSVRDQSIRNIEIICIDAGSTDGTIDIIKKHAEQDNRIKYYPSEVRSYGYQLNLGLKLASGKYVGIVETDDYVDSQMYESLVAVAEKDSLDFVKADYMAFITQDNGERFYLKRENFDDKSIYNKVIYPKEYPEVATADWYNCQGIYRLEYIRDNKIEFSETPGAAFQDIGFLYYAIINAKRAEYTRDLFYRYRIDRVESSSNSGRGIKYSYDEFKRLVDKTEELNNTDKDELRILYSRMAKSFLSSYAGASREYLLSDDSERKEIYIWFKEKMSQAIKDGLVCEKDMNPSIWNGLMLLLESEEKYSNGQIELVEEVQRTRAKHICIFGSGNHGYRAHCVLRKNGLNNDMFCDNTRDLWGKELDGVPVKSPEELLPIMNDVVVVVANVLYSREIADQVLSIGVPSERVIVFL